MPIGKNPDRHCRFGIISIGSVDRERQLALPIGIVDRERHCRQLAFPICIVDRDRLLALPIAMPIGGNAVSKPTLPPPPLTPPCMVEASANFFFLQNPDLCRGKIIFSPIGAPARPVRGRRVRGDGCYWANGAIYRIFPIDNVDREIPIDIADRDNF